MMKFEKNISVRKYLNRLFVSILLLGAVGCADDKFDLPDYTVSGEDVTVTIPVRLPKMDTKTRASLDETSLNTVNSLWIRTYNKDSGRATSEWIKVTGLPTTDVEQARSVELQTRSGYSYIVGVANVEENNGVTKDNLTPRKLSEILENADTWEDFLNVAVESPSVQEDVRAPRPPFPMAGCYTDIVVGGSHPEPTNLADWQNRDFIAYFIPAQKSMVNLSNGAIHLRRLVSHINFNITHSADLDVTVNSYQVVNAPRYSWLYERPSENGLVANFGDMAESQADATTYFAKNVQFGSQFVETNNLSGADEIISFDFWQGENKHTGNCEDFNDRAERSSGNPTLFTALTGDTWTPNNEASCVLISCTVDYNGQIKVGQQGEMNNNGDDVYRTGQATYIIPLGYINNDAKDFNCFRNVNYTYNLQIRGLNDIVLDAHAEEEETYHGEEGVVSDLRYSTVELDAHYHAFNVELTPDELQDKEFGFIITTYDNGTQYSFNSKDDLSGVDEKYYNWIELRATTGPNTLAEYKSRYQTLGTGEKVTFLLTDLCGDGTKGPWDIMTGNMKSDSGWYTVFVNEYTYEPMFTGQTTPYANETTLVDGKPAWRGYVNQNPRRFYIRVTRSVSHDGNSIYTRSKYGVSQNSIQTYYTDQGNNISTTAIGLERENETEGLNLRVNFAGGSSTVNGRYNIAQWLNSKGNGNILSGRNYPSWSDFIDQTKPMEVGAVEGQRAQGGPTIPARTIASGNPVKMPKVNTLAGQTATFNDAQANGDYFIEAVNACMSRNRDNNGNGRIEPDELRWYVPAMGKYLRMILGGNSLGNTALMQYDKISRLPYVNTETNAWATSGTIQNDYYSRYMFVASNNDRNVLWGMEGTSTSTAGKVFEWSKDTSHPWQVRCIRNLGTDLTDIVSEDKVQMAYVANTANHTVMMTYYDAASIRANPYTGNGDGVGSMPVHTINSDFNSMYYGFEYDTENKTIPEDDRPSAPSTTDDNYNQETFKNEQYKLTDYINSNPCSDVGSEWRIPNQRELTIMRNLGILTGNDNTTWLSCTVNYFNYVDGIGANSTDNRFYLVVTPSQGTQLTLANMQYANNHGFYIRCVRDIR